MRMYFRTRDFVDRTFRSLNWYASSLPGALPLFPSMFFDNSTVWAVAWIWFLLWEGFVFWRWWVYMKVEAERSDRAYDRKGKFRLSREYWDTESATASRARKAKKRRRS